ncbi:MAG: HPr family phosphocarrier protein [Pseudonocardiaceae bacterium]
MVLVGTFTVANAHGLHARPASRLVQAVRLLDARVRVRNLTTGFMWTSQVDLCSPWTGRWDRSSPRRWRDRAHRERWSRPSP